MLKRKFSIGVIGTLVILAAFFLLLLPFAWRATSFGKRQAEQAYTAEARSGGLALKYFQHHSQDNAIILAFGSRSRDQVLSTYRNKVAVLMYHDVNPNGRGPYSITPGRLDSDLTILQQKGFRIIPISQLADFLDNKGVVPEKAVVITFDDGYQGVYQYALPVLKKHNAPATAFVIGAYVGKLPGYLNWPEVRALEDGGLVTIGGHTFNQHNGALTGTPHVMMPATIDHAYDPDSKRQETDQEYEARMSSDSQQLQEAFRMYLGHATPYFAFPFGAYDPSLIKILHGSGFRYLFTVLRGVNARNEDPGRLYRINVGAPEVSSQNLPSMILRATLAPGVRKQLAFWAPKWADHNPDPRDTGNTPSNNIQPAGSGGTGNPNPAGSSNSAKPTDSSAKLIDDSQNSKTGEAPPAPAADRNPDK